MKSKFNTMIRQAALLGTAMAVVSPSVASAQAAPANEATVESDIVVLGTLIRGTAVAGSQTISVDSKVLADKAANSTNELLTTIPQIANTFNGRFEGEPRGYSAGISITKPNLRNLPSTNTASSATTLVLLNGMRLAPVGVRQAAVDADIIPGAVLEGVDAVTDGGSSLYGADAVAGVLNFRARKRFEGFKVDANVGQGTTIKAYTQWDGNVMFGKSWSTGNAYVSVGHASRDLVRNGQTKWANGIVFNSAGVGAPSFTQCFNPVGTETRWFRFGAGPSDFTANPAAPGAGVFAVGTPCDDVVNQTYLPKQERTNVFGSLTQQVADNIDLQVTAYWTKRNTELAITPRGYTAAGSTLTTGALVGAAFPSATVGSITTIPGGTSFSFQPNAAYRDVRNRVGFETWGVTSELTFDLGGAWQLRNTTHFGRSTNFQRFAGVDQAKAQAYIDAGSLNPRNVAAASAAVVNDILNYEDAQDTKQELFDNRIVADGPLFPLPGGEAKLAVGLEYQDNVASSRLASGQVNAIGGVNFARSQRNAKSAFAEVSLPVLSVLDLTGSVRFDSYSDFGSTTNPNLGFTLKPVSWFKVFGHWNTSFNAPTAIDGLAIATGRFRCGIYVAGSTNAGQRPFDPLGRDTSKQGTCAMVLEGSSPNLKPQTADSWAIGFEATPVQGLRFGGEFYAINFKNALGALNPALVTTYTTNPSYYTYNITSAAYTDLLKTLTNGATLGAQRAASDIALVVDTRVSNINSAKAEGVDFHVNYDQATSMGLFAWGLSGTLITRDRRTTSGQQTNELNRTNARFAATTFLNWVKGGYSARLTVNYTGQFRDSGTDYLGRSDQRVSPFVVTNLMTTYNFGEKGGPLNGTTIRLGVDNLLNVSPQMIMRSNTNNLSYNNWTLGRVVKLGFSKTF
jgi:iron complex outermembrane receptor protein